MQQQRSISFVLGLLKVFLGTCMYQNYGLIFRRKQKEKIQRTACRVQRDQVTSISLVLVTKATPKSTADANSGQRSNANWVITTRPAPVHAN